MNYELKPLRLCRCFILHHSYFIIASKMAAMSIPTGQARTQRPQPVEGLAELVVVVLELVHDPVAVPLGLHIPWVVARSVIGELAEAAGVPVLAAGPFPLRPFAVDVEAGAGRAAE